MATGADIIIESFRREGVEYVFGLPGGAVMPIFDSILDSKIELILTRHEQGATHMADGYARATGKTGVVMVTSGPGATNTVTGLLTAHMDSAPIVVVSGQQITPMLGKDAFQEADIFGITIPVVKHSYLVKDVNDIPRVMKEAFFIASSGRPGPVLVDVPKDIASAECNTTFPEDLEEHLPGYNFPQMCDMESIYACADLIHASKRPLLYVGQGARISGAAEVVREFAEKLRAPVTTTLLGKGAFPETNDLSVGMLGMHGTAYANKTVVDCDLIMAIGARWDDRITGKLSEFCTDAKKIHLDIDPAEHGKIIQPDVSLVGDARLILEELIEHVNRLDTALAQENRRVEEEVPPQVPQARRPEGPARPRFSQRPDRWRGDRHYGCRPAPDVVRPVLQDGPRLPVDHQRWSRDHGLRNAGRHRRPIRPA